MRRQPSSSVVARLSATWVLTPLVAGACVFGLSGCGQKGPLVLPPAAAGASAPSR